MTSARDPKDQARPWHLLLTPAIPLLGLLKEIQWYAPATVVFAPLVVATAISLLLAVVLVPLGKDRHRSALAVSFLMIAGLSYLMVALPLAAIASKAAVYVAYGVVALGTIKLLRTPGSAAPLTVTANRVVAIAVVLLAAPIVWGEWQRPRSVVPPLALSPAAGLPERPDVYVIVLDGYAREDVLRDVFSFENTLVADLRAAGFHVADQAAANYSQTALSLASALNGDYLSALNPVVRHPKDRRGLGDLINHSRFFRAFSAAGYRIRAYSSEYALVRPAPADDRPSPLVRLNDFSYTVYETTIVPRILDAIGFAPAALPMHAHRRHITWTLRHIADAAPQDSQPVLVFAHILAPHPPFAFDASGNARRTHMPALLGDGDMWHRMATATGESYKNGYVDTLRALNARLTTTVRSIVSSGRKSIVLIHGDHGPGSGLDWERPDRTDVRERLSILAALRFPEGEAPPIEAVSTPINIYRAVLNRALNANLPAIDNRSFHSTWERPFDLIDVTDRLKAIDTPGATSVALKGMQSH